MKITDIEAHYVISLPSRKDRLDGFLWRAKARAGITPQVEPGIIADPPCDGARLAEIRILEAAQKAGIRSLVIFEDDCVFDLIFEHRLAVAGIPKDWQWLYFGCLHIERPTRAGAGCVRVAKAFDTHALAFRGEGIQAAIDALKTGSGPPDVRLAERQKSLPAYALSPNLCWQEIGYSDIQKKQYSNYDSRGKQVWAEGMDLPLP